MSQMNSNSPPLGFLGFTPENLEREQFADALARYEYHAHKAQGFLLEAFALDDPKMARDFPHLRRVHVPRLAPDPTRHPSLSTTESALLSAKPRQRPEDTAKCDLERRSFDKTHPDYQPLTDEQKARRYSEGGYVDMPREMARHFGIPLSEVAHFTDLARNPAAPTTRTPPTRPENSPKPWRDSK